MVPVQRYQTDLPWFHTKDVCGAQILREERIRRIDNGRAAAQLPDCLGRYEVLLPQFRVSLRSIALQFCFRKNIHKEIEAIMLSMTQQIAELEPSVAECLKKYGIDYKVLYCDP